MDKRAVEKWLPAAASAIRDNLAETEHGKKVVDKGLRGQISGLGAAIEMGSLLAAVAFYSNKGGAQTDRQHIIRAIESMLKADRWAPLFKNDADLFQAVLNARTAGTEKELRQDILACAVALKLAMNLFEPKKEKEDRESRTPQEAPPAESEGGEEA